MASLKDRFMDKVHCEPNTGCWLWAGSDKRNGYGGFGYRDKIRAAHRVSYEMHVGPIPTGLMVLHRCDVRSCVNPDHLYAGTLADNVRDAHARQRYQRGEEHIRSKLTTREVREIRDLEGRFSQISLGEKYGVSQKTISAIQRRVTWRHVR